MTFVNEFVSEEDVRSNKLDELKKKMSPWAWRDGRPSVFRHDWTIDRERGAFLYFAKTWEEMNPSGRPQHVNKFTCLLRCREQDRFFFIGKTPETSIDMHERPYRLVWELLEKEMLAEGIRVNEETLPLLKEALIAYGKEGVWRQVPDTIVQFKF